MVYFIQQGSILVQSNVNTNPISHHNTKIVDDFISTKSIEGCSKQTLKSYRDALEKFVTLASKNFEEISSQDIKEYLVNYQLQHEISNRSLDNIRRIFSTFFNFMEDEDYINKNPMKKIHRIKSEISVKKPFTDDDIVRLTDVCRTARELAIIDFLNYTGVRVSELCKLNREDIDFDRREGIVYGKGNKQRVIYINSNVKVHLLKYLEDRVDSSKALFVTERAPYTRVTKSGIEQLCATIGIRAKVDGVYPHRFRRTLATRLINRGVPIEQVQTILGHTKIDTTLIYAKVNEANVKLNHQKFA